MSGLPPCTTLPQRDCIFPPPPPAAKLKIAREEYTRLLSLAEDGSGGRGDVPHHSLVRSRRDQGSSGLGKPARRVKSASACLHEQREGGLSKVTEGKGHTSPPFTVCLLIVMCN